MKHAYPHLDPAGQPTLPTQVYELTSWSDDEEAPSLGGYYASPQHALEALAAHHGADPTALKWAPDDSEGLGLAITIEGHQYSLHHLHRQTALSSDHIKLLHMFRERFDAEAQAQATYHRKYVQQGGQSTYHTTANAALTAVQTLLESSGDIQGTLQQLAWMRQLLNQAARRLLDESHSATAPSSKPDDTEEATN